MKPMVKRLIISALLQQGFCKLGERGIHEK